MESNSTRKRKDGRWLCDCCKQPAHYYMVHDAVWLLVCKRNEMLCLPCFEVKLGRKLGCKDFTNFPVNRNLREGYGFGYFGLELPEEHTIETAWGYMRGKEDFHEATKQRKGSSD